MSARTDTAERILTAASELFAERGYSATTTRVIAQRAGVNEVTLFRHFGNKRGILEALGESWKTRMAGFAVEQLPDPANTRATLETLARIEVAQAIAAGPTAMRLVLDASFTPEVAQVMGAGPADNFTGLAAYLAQRQAEGDLRADLDARVMAEAFFALTSQIVMSRQVLQGSSSAAYGMDDETVAVQLFELFYAGIARRGEHG